MRDKVLVSTLRTTIGAAITIVLVDLLMGKPITWQSTIVFVIVFGVVFYIGSTLLYRKNK